MRTGLTKQEKTTDIWFDEKDPLIHIRTHNTDLKKRLAAYSGQYPECYMLGKWWTGAYCRYFREAVLPLDPVLMASICEDGLAPDTRLCAVCGRPFLPEGRQAYCSDACKVEGNRRRSRERMRKKRRGAG